MVVEISDEMKDQQQQQQQQQNINKKFNYILLLLNYFDELNLIISSCQSYTSTIIILSLIYTEIINNLYRITIGIIESVIVLNFIFVCIYKRRVNLYLSSYFFLLLFLLSNNKNKRLNEYIFCSSYLRLLFFFI